MKTVRGCCPLDCPDTCSWEIDVADDGRATAIRGLREHPFTRGALCGKVNRYLESVYDPERLTQALVRVGRKGEGRFAAVPLDEALDRAAAGIRAAIDAHGPEAVLPFYFAGTMGKAQAWTVGPRIFAHLGASRLATTICTAAAQEALEVTVGGSVGLDPEDVAHAQLVIFWGSNPLSTNIHQWRFALEARKRGALIVTVDPLRSPTAEASDWHVAPTPGSDSALVLGVMRRLRDRGAVDEDWARAHTVGFDRLDARLDEWPVERAAALCGLDVDVIERLGDLVAERRPTAIRVGLGLQRNAAAGMTVRSVMSVPALTGDWRHVGGGAVCMTDDHLPIRGAFEAVPDLPVTRGRVINMSRLGEALTELDEPAIHAMVVWSANPAATNPDQERVLRGLARDDLFTVVIEQRRTDTVDYADVVLPCTMQPEHLDMVVPYGHLYVQWNEPALEPPGDCLPTSEVLRRLATRLGLDHPRLHDADREVLRGLLDSDAARAAGLTVEALSATGYVRGAAIKGVAPFAQGGFPTPSGKVELYSERLAERGLEPLVGYAPTREVADQELARRLPLVLVAPAGRFFLNSTFAQLPWNRAKMQGPRVYLHPDDAAARGIEAGATVRVFNDRGEFEAVAEPTLATRVGVCFTLKVEWPKLSPGGRNANATTPIRDADYGGAPTFHDNRVEVALAPR